MEKYLLIIAGFLSLGTGIIGIFIPLLPTTPFLLLAAVCFLKSSEKLYNWLVGHRVFGKYIENYIKYRAVSKKSKIISIAILWFVIFISILVIDAKLIKILLALIAIGVTWHILSLKSFDEVSDKGNGEKNKIPD